MDKSLDAFKAWIKNLCAQLGIPDDTTDQEYEEDWKKFWAPKEDKKTP